MIYGLTKGTDFEKLCDGAAKAEAAGVMTYYALARMAKEQGYPEEVSETFIEMANQEAVHAGFYATLNGKYNARDGSLCQAGRPSWCHLAGYDRKIQEIAQDHGYHGVFPYPIFNSYQKSACFQGCQRYVPPHLRHEKPQKLQKSPISSVKVEPGRNAGLYFFLFWDIFFLP